MSGVDLKPSVTASAPRFAAVSEHYDAVRPEPPEAIFTTLLALAGAPPELVADIGCGTGISTRPWAQRAARVVGVDPAISMVARATEATASPNVCYRVGHGAATGLDDASVDILTCASSIHWMEPVAAFGEFKRVLRPGGVFAAYGPQVPFLPLPAWDVAALLNEFLGAARIADRALYGDDAPTIRKWAEMGRYGRESGVFRYSDELCFHHIVSWDAERYLGWLASFSYVNSLLLAGHRETVEAFARIEALCRSRMGAGPVPVQLSYRLMLGIA